MSSWICKITHVRITLSPWSSEEMADIGETMVTTYKNRIQSATDVFDNPALPLTPKYAKYKSNPPRKQGSLSFRRPGKPIRDWTFTGRTLGSLKVKSANENQVRIGFINERADMIVGVQNRKNRLWGTSPADDAVFQMALYQKLIDKGVRALIIEKVA